jgi:hypothetical protein
MPATARVAALCVALTCTSALAQTPEPPKPAGPPQAPAGGTPEKIPFGAPYGAPITSST